MNRLKLISAVQQSAMLYGYNFRTLASDALAAQSPQMPAALLCEPKFQSIVGRNHGRITYQITLHLLNSGKRLSPEQRSQGLSTLQQHALQIFTTLSEHSEVAVVRELVITPTANTIVGRGEVGVEATALVETIF